MARRPQVSGPCGLCGEVFLKSSFEAHRSACERKAVPCSTCGEKFAATQLKHHWRSSKCRAGLAGTELRVSVEKPKRRSKQPKLADLIGDERVEQAFLDKIAKRLEQEAVSPIPIEDLKPSKPSRKPAKATRTKNADTKPAAPWFGSRAQRFPDSALLGAAKIFDPVHRGAKPRGIGESRVTSL